MKFLSQRIKILIIILGILIIASLNFFQKETKNFFYSISAPIQKKLWRAGANMSAFFETISEIKNLKKENEENKLKIQELLTENAKLKEFKKENEILREALNIGLQKEFTLFFAQIISKDPDEDSVLIDKGSEDGILEDFPVITQQKVLVGKISEVNKNFSRIMLLTNKNSSFTAKIIEREVSGAIKGKGNFKVFFELIPQDKEIFPGDEVFTSRLGGIFPEGLLVGEVKEVKKSDIEPFQQAEIIPAFSIAKAEYLFIISKF